MADRDLANKPADYIRDIAHLLPAELTAFYISIKGIIPSAVNPQGVAGTAADAAKSVAPSPDSANATANAIKLALLNTNLTTLSLLFLVAIVLTVLFYFIMPAMLTINSPSQRALYCITFIIWVLGIEVDRLSALLQGEEILGTTSAVVARTLINLLVAIWSFTVPYIFQRINPSRPASPAPQQGG